MTRQLNIQDFIFIIQATKFTIGVGTDGYTENTVLGQIKEEYNYGIYVDHGWLASPCCDSDGSMLNTYDSDGIFCYDCYVGVYCNSCRPIVCMKTDVFEEKYASTLKEE